MSQPAEEYLRTAKILVSPDTFHIISVSHEKWGELLSDPELSPTMASEFLIFKDRWEVTIVVDELDFARLRPGLEDAKVEGGFRMLSFDVEMPFDVVGFMACVSAILAEVGISILPFSSFRRDHLLVHQNDLAAALKAFRGIVEEVC